MVTHVMSFIVRPSKWEVEHAKGIFAGQAYAATHGGELPDTPMWRMLEFRHTLNPARFDFWHPNVGLLLESRPSGTPTGGQPAPQELTEKPITPTTPVTPPTEVPPTTTTREQEIPPTPHAVPEPTAVFQGLMAATLAVALIAKRRGVISQVFSRITLVPGYRAVAAHDNPAC
jgi:hypothetical protein